MIRPVAIIGPTASGKSALGLDLAERIGGEIVNIDAMQQYRGMDIGTAKLTLAERRGIPHHQIDTLHVTEIATVANYKTAAARDVELLVSRDITPIIVGGSMMYIQALIDDWQFPATDPAVRAKWEARLDEVGVRTLHAELARIDPAAATTILPTDPRRTVRALEVIELTGRPFAASAPQIGEPQWGTIILGVDRDTEELDERIAQRTEAMFRGGLVEEVKDLISVGLREGVTASRAIGYAQTLAALDGEYSLQQAQDLTLQGTRRYVRRQRSWFKRDHRIQWIDGADADMLGTALQAIRG
ncbi:tRNA (adenosine(37)-N6)-dimethylallyltransferase MiaA [Hoyosella subflava]|uniref:tRNA dimethylallyltransferase n=1 Tax=Hoyosella subflava (strain DSM 45089 / JCM 17490 / NBRC 109087 / DQS3-9A1) TaxID=443218 RepID=F6EKM7_HOYSD|nr:tRNA (adenosine(37)-N6)-dimethylallyltransferase MiaA [Hoyosella subflava]AEF40163.1 tRNA dimethylallyltransferase [Hoyosella subflava DQS3-9A1]